MHCSYCHRPLRLLDGKHPQRLLLPRCRACGRYTLGAAHKIILTLMVAVVVYLLMSLFLPTPRPR